MAEKKISDYLHLYLGCEVETTDNEVADLHYYGKLEAVQSNGDFVVYTGTGYTQKQSIHFKSKQDIIKPILRRLDSMTEEEAYDVAVIADCLPTGWERGEYQILKLEHPNQGIEVLYGKRYSVRVTHRVGIYFYDREKPHAAIFIPKTAEIIRYLLSKSFDLFGLIDAGLALDKEVSKQ